MKSILQDKKQCFVTGDTQGLHKHHIFNSFNRDNSEKFGLWIWLRWDYHIADSPNHTPHNDKDTDLFYKRMAQRKFEETASRERFVEIFGRNYLD